MAPELCGGKEASPQSDLYAVALVLYTLVTGKPPFKSSRASTTLKRQIYEKPLPLKLVKPGVTGIADFEAVLQRALEKEPGKRYGDASEFLDALVAFAGEHFPGVGLEGGAVDAIAAPAPAENVVEESADDEVEVAEEVDVEMESADSDEESSVSEESDDSSEEPEAMVIGPDEEADLRILVESGALSVDSKVRREGENQIRTVGELLEENASKDSEDDDVEAEDIEDEIASSIEEDESTEALDEVEQAEEDESEPDDDDDSDEVAPEEDTEGEDGIDEAEGSSADDGDELDSETDGDDGDDDAWFSEDDEDFGAGIGASGGGSAAKIGILVAVIVVIVAVVMNMGGDESEAPAVVDAVAVEEPAEPILLDYEKDEADSNEEAAEEEAAVEEAVPAISKECLAKQMELAEKCCGESKATWKDGKCDLQEDAQKSVFVECMTKNQPIAECEPPSEEKEEAPIPSNDELKRKMQLAQAAIKKGKFDTAEELYNGILKEAPDFAEATTALKALPGLKKAAEEAAKKKAAEEAAKKKAAEEAAKKKAAEEAAKKKAAEEAAKKKASKDVKKKAAKKEKKAKKSPKKDVKKAKKTEKKEEKASKVDNTAKAKEMMKKGMGAMKAKNNRLALKYFQKAKKLAPKMKLIDKYIEKAKAAK